MNRSAHAPILALAVALTLAGQTTSDPVSAAVASRSDGSAQISLQNQSGKTVTAFAYSASFTGGPQVVEGEFFRDSAILEAERPIVAGATVTRLAKGPAGAVATSVHLRAVLFSDGSSFGDSTWVQRLLLRRQYAAKGLDSALRDVASVAQLSTADAVAYLKSSKASLIARATSPDEALCISPYYNILLGQAQSPNTSQPIPAATIQSMTKSLQYMRSKLGN
jgi:hypothetical protein